MLHLQCEHWLRGPSTGVSDDIEVPIAAANCVSSETNGAVREALAVVVQVGVAPPAVVNGIP